MTGSGWPLDGIGRVCIAAAGAAIACSARPPRVQAASAPTRSSPAASPPVAFDAAGRAVVLNALVGRMMAQNVATEPNANEVRTELDSMITRLAACGGSCPAGRTETIVKATCAALLGSAVTLVN